MPTYPVGSRRLWADCVGEFNVRIHPERFSAPSPQSTGMRSLLSLIEQRRELVGDKTPFTNRLPSKNEGVVHAPALESAGLRPS